MVVKFLRVILGLIVALFVSGIIVVILRALGPIIGGLIVMLFNLSPKPDLARIMDALGNLIVFVLALYPAIKVYKKITGKQNIEKQVKEN